LAAREIFLLARENVEAFFFFPGFVPSIFYLQVLHLAYGSSPANA